MRVKKASIERSSPSTCSSFDTGNNKMGGDYVKIFGKIFQNNVLVDDPMKKSASTPTLSSLNNDNEVVADMLGISLIALALFNARLFVRERRVCRYISLLFLILLLLLLFSIFLCLL